MLNLCVQSGRRSVVRATFRRTLARLREPAHFRAGRIWAWASRSWSWPRNSFPAFSPVLPCHGIQQSKVDPPVALTTGNGRTTSSVEEQAGRVPAHRDAAAHRRVESSGCPAARSSWPVCGCPPASGSHRGGTWRSAGRARGGLDEHRVERLQRHAGHPRQPSPLRLLAHIRLGLVDALVALKAHLDARRRRPVAHVPHAAGGPRHIARLVHRRMVTVPVRPAPPGLH